MRVENRMDVKNDMHLKNDTQITSERQIDIACKSEAARVPKRAQCRRRI